MAIGWLAPEESATIWGNDASEQARQIVDHVAHPAAREELVTRGRELGFTLP